MIDPTMLQTSGSTGAMMANDVEGLRKALEAGYGTDVATLTGGGALRIQSLDHVMQSTIQENKHFRLFNRLPKPKAGATVDEWTEQNAIGGWLGGSTNTEIGNILNSTGSYNRRVGMVKYLMTMRQVSFVQTLQDAIAESEAVEYNNGALQLLTDAEYLSFEGNSAVVATEFDGIYTQLVAGISSGVIDAGHVVDAQGGALNNMIPINSAAAEIAGYGNFGTPTDIFVSQLTQADFDSGLDPAFRVPLPDVANGGISLGSPVKGIRTSWGDIANQPDVFVRDEAMQMPFEVVSNSQFSALAGANNSYQPISVTPGSPGINAASMFQAQHAGLYYYGVAGTANTGDSQVVVTSQVNIAAGDNVVLTIVPSSGGAETGYTIFRGRKNGTSGVSDLRFMTRVPKASTGNTTYTDNNTDMPGTTKAFILNLLPSATAITWRQLLPMIKFPLYPTQNAIVPWAQLLFGYLRISKRRHHVVIKNIVTKTQGWQPFGAGGY